MKTHKIYTQLKKSIKLKKNKDVHLEGNHVIKKGIRRGSEGAWDSAPASSWDADSPIAETPILRLELRCSVPGVRVRVGVGVGGGGFFPRPSRPRRQPLWPSSPPPLRRGLSWLWAKPWNLNLIYRCWEDWWGCLLRVGNGNGNGNGNGLWFLKTFLFHIEDKKRGGYLYFF